MGLNPGCLLKSSLLYLVDVFYLSFYCLRCIIANPMSIFSIVHINISSIVRVLSPSLRFGQIANFKISNISLKDKSTNIISVLKADYLVPFLGLQGLQLKKQKIGLTFLFPESWENTPFNLKKPFLEKTFFENVSKGPLLPLCNFKCININSNYLRICKLSSKTI